MKNPSLFLKWFCLKFKLLDCKQGHPTTVFSKISVRTSKYCLEFSIAQTWLKISGWAFHSGTIFEAYLRTPYDFLKFNFSHFTPHVRLIFVEKRNQNFRIQKYDGVRNKKNSHFRKTFNCILTFRKNNTEAFVVSKSLKLS